MKGIGEGIGVGIGEGNSLMGDKHFPKLKPGTSSVIVGAPLSLPFPASEPAPRSLPMPS